MESVHVLSLLWLDSDVQEFLSKKGNSEFGTQIIGDGIENCTCQFFLADSVPNVIFSEFEPLQAGGQ